MSSHPKIPFSPFILLTTNNLVLVPTPIAISSHSYCTLYAGLHADASFCQMAFSHHFLPRVWEGEETRATIRTRDVERCWERRGMGDFAIGRMAEDASESESLRGSTSSIGRVIGGEGAGNGGVRIVEGDEHERFIRGGSGDDDGDGFFDRVEWIGYAGVRDATTTSMPPRTPEDPILLPWQEMIELRYGVAQPYWGKGMARIAADAVMKWAVSERGVKRFIAETERENERSGRVLEKMCFVPLGGTEYWKEPSEMEWERVVER